MTRPPIEGSMRTRMPLVVVMAFAAESCGPVRVEPLVVRCGDGEEGPGEVCDETAGLPSCASLVGTGSLGAPVCSPSCDALDLAGCSPPTPILLAPVNDAYLPVHAGDDPVRLCWTTVKPPSGDPPVLYEWEYGNSFPLMTAARAFDSQGCEILEDIAVIPSLAGFRFWWRVRACSFFPGACSDWSSARYFTFGDPNDLDGDGYAEIVIGDGNTTHVFRGGPAPGLLEDAAFPGGEYQAFADVNGDALAELVLEKYVSTGAEEAVRTSRLYVGGTIFQPAPAWMETEPCEVSTISDCGASDAGGDVNGDGYDEMVHGGRLWFGSPDGPSAGGLQLFDLIGLSPVFGSEAAAIDGDVNGDGYSDVLVTGAGLNLYKGALFGQFHVLLGGAGATLDPGIDAIQEMGSFVDFVIADVWSMEGPAAADGFSDLVLVSDQLVVLAGSPTGPVWTAVAVTPSECEAGAGECRVAGGDGLVISGREVGGESRLDAYRVERGTWVDQLALAWTLEPPVNGCDFASDFDLVGDFDGDGRRELVVGARECGRAYVFFGEPGGGAPTRMVELGDSVTSAPGFGSRVRVGGP